MKFLINRFYPIVDSAKQFEILGQLSVPMAQLRIKNHKDDAQLRLEVEQAVQYRKKYNILLILNDFWQIAMECGVDFIHLGQEDLQTADIKALRARHIRIGVSTHDHAELENALSIDPDYVALGPIYPTTSKVMRFGPQGLDRIREWKAKIGKKPLVAIGGLNLERAVACLQAGADSVSVISNILTEGQIDKESVKLWLKTTQQIAK